MFSYPLPSHNTNSGVVLKIKVGICCKVERRRCQRGWDVGHCERGEFFFAFVSQNGEFWCILGRIFTVELLVHCLC